MRSYDLNKVIAQLNL